VHDHRLAAVQEGRDGQAEGSAEHQLRGPGPGRGTVILGQRLHEQRDPATDRVACSRQAAGRRIVEAIGQQRRHSAR
jgi:hypothetical protein